MNPQPDHATAPAVIEIRKFSYSYQGASRRAVDDLSFTVGHGEIFGFLGPSGAGKSTTQNVLIGLLSGYRGSISVLSRDLKEWDRSYYQRIGVAFEAPNHYSKLTALENLWLFALCTTLSPRMLVRCSISRAHLGYFNPLTRYLTGET